MEISSTEKLCQILICSAIQRCRISEDLCRLSVVLKRAPGSGTLIVRISISDTGVGSCLEEFQALDYRSTQVSAEKWDGVLSVTTTSISENEIYHYHLNLNENAAARRLTRLPSTPKNGAKFSGTEVSLCTCEGIDDLVVGITRFFQKMMILKVPMIAVELVVDHACNPGSRCDDLLLSNKDVQFPFPMSNIECLASGLEDYVLKHGNALNEECRACRECLKVGSGVACTEGLGSRGQVVEAVIIIRELLETSHPLCLRECGMMTEVFYFQDFLSCSIPQSSLNTLKSIDWKSYGLTMRRNCTNGDGFAVLEWENLPPFTHIDIALHSYHKQVIPQTRQMTQVDRNLIKKAVKLSLDDIKQKYKGVLFSTHAIKVRSYAPDLARTITGLILSSNDLNFQGECLSLLGLNLQDNVEDKVNNSIQEKIVAVIEVNDRKPQRSRDPTPFLFGDEHIQEPDSPDEDEGEEGLDILCQ